MAVAAELRNQKRSVSFNFTASAQINTGNLSLGSGPLTIEHWINPVDVTNTEYLVYCQESVVEGKVHNGQFYVAWTPYWGWIGGNTPVNPGEWTHIATVYDGTNLIIYRNGVETFRRNQPGVLSQVNVPFKIGARGTSTTVASSPFKGKIRDFRIWKSVRTPEQILHNMYGIGPNESSLFAWWPLGEGQGTTAADLGAGNFAGTFGTGASWVEEDGAIHFLTKGEFAEDQHLETFRDDTIGQFPSKWNKDAGSTVVTTVAGNPNKVAYFPGDGIYHRMRSKWVATVVPGETFKGRIKYKADSGAYMYFGLVYNTGTYNYFNLSYRTEDGWSVGEGTLVVPTGVTSAQIWVFNYVGNSGALWVEDVVVESKRTSFGVYKDGNMDSVEIIEDPRPLNDKARSGSIDGSFESCTILKYMGDPTRTNGSQMGAGGSWACSLHYSQVDEYCEVVDVPDGVEGSRVFRAYDNGSGTWKAFTGASYSYKAAKWYRTSVYARVTSGFGTKYASTYLPYFGTSGMTDQGASLGTAAMADGKWKRLYKIFQPSQDKAATIYLYGHYGKGTIEYDGFMLEEFDTQPVGPPPPLEKGLHTTPDGVLYMVGGEFVEGVEL